MPINVNLTPQLEEMVRRKVRSGIFASASEVVSEALLLMQEKERSETAAIDRLRQDIRDGIQSGEPGLWEPEEVKRRCLEKNAGKPV